MQIVRDLAGYSYGGSDILRRAMSKKKMKVMEEERKTFVYGSEERGIPGCVKNGIDEKTANKIYDEMIDFAKYAFNKSHAAAYAIVSFQTAWLKYYYPVEFMAALMTSVLDNPGKVSEYILVCRQMGIEILPPDINKSCGSFSVEDGKIRFALSAVKGIGRPVMEVIEKERAERGPFQSLQDFCERMSGRQVTKRNLESFIKAGAFDCLGGTRKQYMQVYGMVMDQVSSDRKNNVQGQMSLFDIVPEEQKKNFRVTLPDVGEYEEEEKLAFEKEVAGVYISGHPLQKYEEKWRKNVTAVSTDFALDEENGGTKVRDGSRVTIGGMITDKTVRYTKTNQIMAILTVEDLLGSVEVLVFPKSYEQYGKILDEDAKVFISGRVSEEEERDSKLICERVILFSDTPRQIWMQFEDRDDFSAKISRIRAVTEGRKGHDQIVFYLKRERQVRKDGFVCADDEILRSLAEIAGKENVKVVEKSIEKKR